MILSIAHQARALILAGNSAQAAALLEPHLRANPGDGDAWYYRGHVFFAQKRFPDAVESFRTALRLRPDNADIYSDLGAALSQDQRPGEAEALLREALRRSPENASPTLTLAHVCSTQGR
jgi:cytochrome c-type biogenesis protein CcmH/NrfG